MIDRHLLGDVALAVLLAVPTAALSRPQAPVPAEPGISAAIVQQAAEVDKSATDRRFDIQRSKD